MMVGVVSGVVDNSGDMFFYMMFATVCDGGIGVNDVHQLSW